MKKIALSLIIMVILISSCDAPFGSVDCKCSTQAVKVNLVDENGNVLSADSIKYIFESDTIESIKRDSEGTVIGDVGYHAGDYKIWVYYKGNVTDTIEVTINMGGPSDCRRPSTKRVEIIFNENEYDSYKLSKIGGCGE